MSGLPLWMGEVPEYEIVNGHMQITIGEFAIAMPVNVFMVGCVKGRQAIVRWESNQRTADIIALPVKDQRAKH
jgi:hypothetical protein